MHVSLCECVYACINVCLHECVYTCVYACHSVPSQVIECICVHLFLYYLLFIYFVVHVQYIALQIAKMKDNTSNSGIIRLLEEALGKSDL
jgi:hypothetical protein